jgi:hypothetical protein
MSSQLISDLSSHPYALVRSEPPLEVGKWRDTRIINAYCKLHESRTVESPCPSNIVSSTHHDCNCASIANSPCTAIYIFVQMAIDSSSHEIRQLRYYNQLLGFCMYGM